MIYENKERNINSQRVKRARDIIVIEGKDKFISECVDVELMPYIHKDGTIKYTYSNFIDMHGMAIIDNRKDDNGNYIQESILDLYTLIISDEYLSSQQIEYSGRIPIPASLVRTSNNAENNAETQISIIDRKDLHKLLYGYKEYENKERIRLNTQKIKKIQVGKVATDGNIMIRYGGISSFLIYDVKDTKNNYNSYISLSNKVSCFSYVRISIVKNKNIYTLSALDTNYAEGNVISFNLFNAFDKLNSKQTTAKRNEKTKSIIDNTKSNNIFDMPQNNDNLIIIEVFDDSLIMTNKTISDTSSITEQVFVLNKFTLVLSYDEKTNIVSVIRHIPDVIMRKYFFDEAIRIDVVPQGYLQCLYAYNYLNN